MSWLYGQTWLWYLLAFVVGVLLAWLLLVLPQRRTLSALERGRPSGHTHPDAPEQAAAPVPAAADDRDRGPAVDDAVTEQIPAVDPALSMLDTSTRRPEAAGSASTNSSAAAGLGAAGLGAAVLGAAGRGGADSDTEVTREVPRLTKSEAAAETDPDATTVIDRPAGPDAGAAGPGAGAVGAAGAVAASGTGSADDDGPFGAGSARPAADGSPPDRSFRIKGNVDTMRYHGSRSPYFDRTPAAVWFRTEKEAEAAGFVAWNTRGRRPRRS